MVPLAGVICFLSSGLGQQAPPLALVDTIPLPNVQGGFNHMSVDPGQQRLFAAAPTNGTIEIVDLKAGQALRSMEGERPAAVRFAQKGPLLLVCWRKSYGAVIDESLKAAVVPNVPHPAVAVA